MTTTTKHAKKRISERTDLSLSQFNKKASFIFKHGYKLRRFEGALYEYLCSKSIDGHGYVLRVYEDLIFIFDSRKRTLVTVYPIPEELLPISNYLVLSGSPSIIWLHKDGSSLYVSEYDAFTDDIGEAIEFGTEQKARNFIKNNNKISIMIKQGWEVIII